MTPVKNTIESTLHSLRTLVFALNFWCSFQNYILGTFLTTVFVWFLSFPVLTSWLKIPPRPPSNPGCSIHTVSSCWLNKQQNWMEIDRNRYYVPKFWFQNFANKNRFYPASDSGTACWHICICFRFCICICVNFYFLCPTGFTWSHPAAGETMWTSQTSLFSTPNGHSSSQSDPQIGEILLARSRKYTFRIREIQFTERLQYRLFLLQ